MGANLVHAAVSHGDVGVHGGDVVEQVGVKPRSQELGAVMGPMHAH